MMSNFLLEVKPCCWLLHMINVMIRAQEYPILLNQFKTWPEKVRYVSWEDSHRQVLSPPSP